MFYRFFQLIFSTNKPITAYSYNQLHIHTDVCMLNTALHARSYLLMWYIKNNWLAMNTKDYIATEMIINALNSIYAPAQIIEYIHEY